MLKYLVKYLVKSSKILNHSKHSMRSTLRTVYSDPYNTGCCELAWVLHMAIPKYCLYRVSDILLSVYV